MKVQAVKRKFRANFVKDNPEWIQRLSIAFIRNYT
jgi:hypothetical protein